jgi:pimeloyl-ACP methyl ester carboxylesterase
MALSPPVQAWRDRGQVHRVEGRDIFYVDSGEGEATVVIHGFPGSSHDWAAVVPLLPGRVIALDLPGYGFSDKSASASYSLFDQADVVEHLLHHLGVERCVILAHDMGDTVTAELASRANVDELAFSIEHIILTNGSIFIDMAQLTRGQRLTLKLPDRRSLIALPTVILKKSLAESFTRTAPAPAGAIDGLIELIRYGGGDRLMPRLIRYIEERRTNQERWTAGFVDFGGPLTLIWGEEDPIAVLPMTARMTALRPSTTVVPLAGVGHWPSLEVPAQLAGEISAAMAREY